MPTERDRIERIVFKNPRSMEAYLAELIGNEGYVILLEPVYEKGKKGYKELQDELRMDKK